jgi:hypothetical protein
VFYCLARSQSCGADIKLGCPLVLLNERNISRIRSSAIIEICPDDAVLAKIGQNNGHVTRRSTDVAVIIATETRQIFNGSEKYFRQKLHRKLKNIEYNVLCLHIVLLLGFLAP